MKIARFQPKRSGYFTRINCGVNNKQFHVKMTNGFSPKFI